jgi:hypothetical protein
MGEFLVSLHAGQSAIYNSPARFKVCAAGRRFGKTHFAALMLGIEALKTVNEYGQKLTIEHGVYYVAPTFDQAKRVMWPKLKELLGYEKTGGLIRNENINDGWLELISGRKIYIKGADNPDSLRGIGLSYVVLDEYADMKSNVWEEIIDPALMDVRGHALFIGTPKGKNHFYKLFMGALEKLEGYEDWEAFHFMSMDNPFLDEKELERMMNNPNKSREVVRQEIEASFISGGGKVLKPDWFPVQDKMPGAEAQGSWYITVDLAGFASTKRGQKVERLDESVVAATFVTADAWYIHTMKHGHWDVRETALQIVLMCKKFSGARLGIESGALMNAVGPYLEDYMREYSRYIHVEPLRHGNTKKIDRITWALQGRAERGKIKLIKGDWNEWFLDQIADFPDPLAHDDGPDTIAYVDQMATVSYVNDFDIEEWEPLDLDSGY